MDLFNIPFVMTDPFDFAQDDRRSAIFHAEARTGRTRYIALLTEPLCCGIITT
ncbi:hypothetical protein BH23CHL1_BH23CHL1_18340 [soil metagenome]